MHKKQHHFKRNLLIILIIILIIVSGLAAKQYLKYKYEGVHFKKIVYPIRAVFEHHKNLGITGNRSLDYPRIPIGTAVTRDIQLNNIYGFKIRIVPSADGNVTPYIISSMGPVILEEGEMRKFNVTIHGKGLPGNYSGNLTLDIYKLP